MRALVCAAALLLSGAAHAEAPTALQGRWEDRKDFGPASRGELVLTHEDGAWHAELGDATAHGASLDLTFADDQGRFSGARRGRTIVGWWRQPPGLPGQAYMTPVTLYQDGASRWRGDVTPLAQTFTMTLRVAQDDAGHWYAAFRNREFNMNGGAGWLEPRVAGDAVTFLGADGRVVRDGARADGTLRLAWPPLPMPLVLTRATNVPAPERGVGLAPPQSGDGWRTARPSTVGFDEAALSALVARIAGADPFARRAQLIHSLLVSRQGRLVLEEYFAGHDREMPHDLRSAGKTLSAILVGAAHREGARIGPDTRLYDLVAPQGPFANPDPRKSAITLAHLMTHTSGLACNDNDENSPGNEGAMQGQSVQPDWRRFALDLPMAHAPGTRYAYCSAGMNLVGAALEAATGEDAPDLFDRLVARPLAFGRYHWNLAPDGKGYLGGGVHMRPRDLLKLGQLHLDRGVWNGRRILERAWVEDSTRAHVTIDEASTGMDDATFANVATHGSDGYAWHRYGVRVGERLVPAYEANGNGGQFLIVVPEYDLVVVITGGNYGQGGIWTKWRNDIVGAGVAAAILR